MIVFLIISNVSITCQKSTFGFPSYILSDMAPLHLNPKGAWKTRLALFGVDVFNDPMHHGAGSGVPAWPSVQRVVVGEDAYRVCLLTG